MEEQQENLPDGLDLSKDELKKEMLLLPKLIHQMRKTLLQQEKNYSDKLAERKQQEYILSKDIRKVVCKETEEVDGKKVASFKTAVMKDDETKYRVRNEKEVCKLRAEEEEQKKLLDETKRDIEYCQNRLYSIQRLAPLFYGDIKN